MVALLMVVLGFTGFVAPGFLVGDESESNDEDGGPSPSGRSDSTVDGDEPAGGGAPVGGDEPAGGGAPAGGGGVQEGPPASLDEFGLALAQAVDQHAGDELDQMLCADAAPYPRDAFAAVDGIDGAELVGTEETSPNEGTVTLDVTFGSVSSSYDFVVVQEAEGFCVQDGGPAA